MLWLRDMRRIPADAEAIRSDRLEESGPD